MVDEELKRKLFRMLFFLNSLVLSQSSFMAVARKSANGLKSQA